MHLYVGMILKTYGYCIISFEDLYSNWTHVSIFARVVCVHMLLHTNAVA